MRAPGTLMKSELFRIFDTIPSLAWTVLPDGCADLINQRWCEYTGLSAEEACGEGWKAVIHGDDLPRLLAGWHALKVTGRAGGLEVRMRHSEGGYRWFLVQMKPLADASGQIVKWCGICTDIDDRKRSEDGFRSAERDFSSIIDTIPALVWSSRVDGSAEFFNQHYLDFAGLSADAARDWGWTDVIHPDDVLHLLTVWRRIMASQRPGEVEARMCRFDGQYRWILFRLNPLRDEYGQVIRWYGISIDIDDRKRAEENLRRSEAFLTEGQRISLTGSFSWCIDSARITFSCELYRIFGFAADETVTLDRIAGRIHPDDIAAFAERMLSVQHGSTDLDDDVRLVMPDGTLKHVRVVSHRVAGSDEQPEIIGAIQDVTQRRMADEALSNLRAELARMSRIHSLGALTASIAHEVNQPLSGIVTNAGTCLRMLSAGPPNIDGAIETARRTIRDAHRAAEVIARVRAIFSKKAGAMEPLCLNEATRDVIALSQATLHNARVVLKTEFANDLPLVMGDRVQLQQVILNLLLNASEAMAGIDNHPRQMLIRTESQGDYQVCLTVRDAGVGLQAGELARIFDAFYSTKEGGTGIGLAISRSIIDRHDGRLGAAANDGPGASFWFSIPCIAHGMGSAAAPLAVPAARD
jgi:PAS domain S-box-containing protein